MSCMIAAVLTGDSVARGAEVQCRTRVWMRVGFCATEAFPDFVSPFVDPCLVHVVIFTCISCAKTQSCQAFSFTSKSTSWKHKAFQGRKDMIVFRYTGILVSRYQYDTDSEPKGSLSPCQRVSRYLRYIKPVIKVIKVCKVLQDKP